MVAKGGSEMKKGMLLFGALLVSGLGLAGGIDKGSLAITVPCAIVMAVCGICVALMARE